MKVLLITNNDYDGVGQHVARLNSIFRQKKVNSRTLVIHKKTRNPYIIKIKRSFFLRIFFYLINYLKKKKNTLFSFDLGTVFFKSIQNYINQSDVIIIFSLHRFLSLNNFEDILKTNKLIYLRPLDFEFASGGCHINLNNDSICRNFISKDCRSCPLLNNLNIFNISNKIFLKKKYLIEKYKPKTFVENIYTQKLYNKSKIFNKNNTKIIYLGNTNLRTKKISKLIARKKLKLDQNDKVLLFGSFILDNPYKGGHLLLKSLKILVRSPKIQNFLISHKIKIITFGKKNNFNINIPGIDWIHLGLINSDKMLNYIYRASDILVCPSINDNGPHIIAEAISNDLPVIAYDQGLASEVIIQGKNGFLISCYDVKEFSNSTEKILLNKLHNKVRDKSHLNKAKLKFDSNYEANMFIKNIRIDLKKKLV